MRRTGWRVTAVAVLMLLSALILVRPVRPVATQPRPDAQSYAQLAESLADGELYRVRIEGEPEGSRYPPGAPVMLAPFSAAGVPLERAAQILTIGLLVAVWALAWRLGGPMGASVATVIVGSSPSLLQQSSFVMADVATAMVTVVAGWCVVSGRHRLAGVLAGWAMWTRLAGVVTVLGMRRRAIPVFVLLGLGLVVAKLVLGFGYRGGEAEWSLGHVTSDDGLVSAGNRGGNLWAYATMLAGFGGGLTWPGVLLIGWWGAWRLPGGRWALSVTAGTIVVYLAYFYQAPRFMFAVLALGAVYAGAVAGRWVGSAQRRQQVA